MELINNFEKLIFLFSFLAIFTLTFLAKPVLGLCVLAVLRGLFTFTFIQLGQITFTMEGIINFYFLILGLIYLIAHRVPLFKTPTARNFALLLVFMFLGFCYVSDHIEFIKKVSRIFSYYILYMIIIHLSQKEKAIKWFAKAIFIALIAPLAFGTIEAISTLSSGTLDTIPQKGFVHSMMTKNTFGFFCAFMLLFSMAFYVHLPKNNKKKPLLPIVIAVTFILMILSLTRAAWLGCFVGVIVLLCSSASIKKNSTIIITLIIICASLLPVLTGGIMGVVETQEGSLNSWQIRKDHIWPAAWQAFLTSPIYGCGLGNDYLVTPEVELIQGYHVYSAHNDYLTLLVETGIVGFVLYLILIASLAKTMLKYMKHLTDPLHKSVCLAGISVLACYLTGGIFEHLFQSPAIGAYAFTIFAMAHGVICHKFNTNPARATAPTYRRPRYQLPKHLQPLPSNIK